ncbi:hypothetical protein [Clostridium luticellarii]|uniref:Uncharacterized protein n=1 Tax=Clostridium luticellarii TaxID=1691940 RepID=A0A2T0BSQ9_9CLOT|nr:hypothetical protein [Clostridium luticellarii]MCI1945619.1 hypothetical protein [Clostridium luticellarii]MCI1969405.1 hypothetical protein [Clostridium luticellarii]MCI1996465.1 hypothetical protein [Clostridium luticellarii]MCI2040818.1 hypothetical protein [Clostridium luticellarii]PRR86921.1 hypothetical protein CLLU_01020 [Clostridium luticellarii]
MNFFFLCIIVLSITEVLSLCIISVFCYNQDKLKMFLGSKTNISKDKILEDFEVEINKPQKENNK